MNKKLNVKRSSNIGIAEKVQYIKPFFPNDTPVLKKTDANGNSQYHNRHTQNEIRTCSTDLETVLLCLLEPLQIIEKALTNDDNIPFANTLTMARQNMTNTIHEIFRFVNNNIGEINITTIHELEINSLCRWGQCVDAELGATDEFEEKAIFDHDPELIDKLKMIPPDKTEPIRDIMRIMNAGDSI